MYNGEAVCMARGGVCKSILLLEANHIKLSVELLCVCECMSAYVLCVNGYIYEICVKNCKMFWVFGQWAQSNVRMYHPVYEYGAVFGRSVGGWV